MNLRTSLSLASLLLATSGTAQAQFLLVPDSGGDVVLLLDAFDGSVVNPAFIDVGAVGGVTPIEAITVGDEIWVSDQSADSVFRFSAADQSFIGAITGGMDNIRGLALANGSVYVSNSATGSGAPGDALVTFDTAGTPTGSFPVGDPFDVIDFNGMLMTCDIANDDLALFAYDGTPMGVFFDSDGVTSFDFPEQVAALPTGGVLVACFSAPVGVYEYDAAGTELNVYPPPTTSGLRGTALLGNGNILMTSASGIFSYDPGTGTHTTIDGSVNGRFAAPFAGGAFSSFCAGDGSAAPCPCGNESPAGGGAGCLHSFGTGGLLSVSGTPSVAADTVLLSGDNLPPTAPALYFQGTAQENGGMGNAFGDGLRCVGGTVIRLGTKASVSGSSSYGQPNGDTAVSVRGMVPAIGGQRYYQAWYRNTAVFCTSAGFNLTNAIGIDWQP